MLFIRDEKVFSLRRTANAVPHHDVATLFSELFCYLLIAGLYREGEGVKGVHYGIPKISDRNFTLATGRYNHRLGQLISEGLKQRLSALMTNPYVNDLEKRFLDQVDYLFAAERGWYKSLSANDFLRIAAARSFSPDMVTVAHYLAFGYGQWDHPEMVTVPQLYLSAFGNIHLSKTKSAALCPPSLSYGHTTPNGITITLLWSVLSAQTVGLMGEPFPGNTLGDLITGLGFLGGPDERDSEIPAPRYAASLYIQCLMGLTPGRPIPIAGAFYQQFFYGSLGRCSVSRTELLDYILNLMMEGMGVSRLDHLFTESSFYARLISTPTLSTRGYVRPELLTYALEALDADPADDDADPGEPPSPDADPKPESDDGGDDQDSAAPSAVPAEASADNTNSIGLISFDRTGEGVDEDLYRQAVVALNDRLQADRSAPIGADVKDALNHWVNGFLYRASCGATKAYVKFLGLQSYLKPVAIKG